VPLKIAEKLALNGVVVDGSQGSPARTMRGQMLLQLSLGTKFGGQLVVHASGLEYRLSGCTEQEVTPSAATRAGVHPRP
jgi:hypothetical protein